MLARPWKNSGAFSYAAAQRVIPSPEERHLSQRRDGHFEKPASASEDGAARRRPSAAAALHFKGRRPSGGSGKP